MAIIHTSADTMLHTRQLQDVTQNGEVIGFKSTTEFARDPGAAPIPAS
jgi:hypothetical protein